MPWYKNPCFRLYRESTANAPSTKISTACSRAFSVGSDSRQLSSNRMVSAQPALPFKNMTSIISPISCFNVSYRLSIFDSFRLIMLFICHYYSLNIDISPFNLGIFCVSGNKKGCLRNLLFFLSKRILLVIQCFLQLFFACGINLQVVVQRQQFLWAGFGFSILNGLNFFIQFLQFVFELLLSCQIRNRVLCVFFSCFDNNWQR